jgi:hypothetical protein
MRELRLASNACRSNEKPYLLAAAPNGHTTSCRDDGLIAGARIGIEHLIALFDQRQMRKNGWLGAR